MAWIRQRLLIWLGLPLREAQEEAWILKLAQLEADLAQSRTRMGLLEMTPSPTATVTFKEEGRLADLPDAHLGAQ